MPILLCQDYCLSNDQLIDDWGWFVDIEANNSTNDEVMVKKYYPNLYTIDEKHDNIAETVDWSETNIIVHTVGLLWVAVYYFITFPCS